MMQSLMNRKLQTNNEKLLTNVSELIKCLRPFAVIHTARE